MIKISKFSFSAIIFLFFFFLSVGVVTAGDAVPFSGIVKKIIPKKITLSGKTRYCLMIYLKKMRE